MSRPTPADHIEAALRIGRSTEGCLAADPQVRQTTALLNVLLAIEGQLDRIATHLECTKSRSGVTTNVDIGPITAAAAVEAIAHELRKAQVHP